MKVTQGHLGGNGAAEHWSWDVALCVCVCVGGVGGGGGVVCHSVWMEWGVECVRIYDVCTEKQQRWCFLVFRFILFLFRCFSYYNINWTSYDLVCLCSVLLCMIRP